jgi:hypothetical protein
LATTIASIGELSSTVIGANAGIAKRLWQAGHSTVRPARLPSLAIGFWQCGQVMFMANALFFVGCPLVFYSPSNVCQLDRNINENHSNEANYNKNFPLTESGEHCSDEKYHYQNSEKFP